MLRNTIDAWGTPAKLLHWTMAAMIVVQVVLGWMAISWKLSPTKISLFVWHKSLGMLLLTLIAVRLTWRLLNPTPALPHMPAWEHAAARVSHGLLYIVLVAMPISGWIINSAANIPFRVFGWFPLPALTAPDKALAGIMKTVHFGFFITLMIVLAVHITAALRHHFVLHNNVFRRMWLQRRARP